MTPTNQIRTATWADEKRVTALVGLAFASDPYVRWLLPDPYKYLKSNEKFVALSSGPAFDDGSVYIIGDFFGVALWLSPGAEIDSGPLAALNTEFCDPAALPDYAGLSAASDAFRPDVSHWYLTLIAVDPAMRGSGYGTALMAHALSICDRDGLPAYLESTNAANLSLYKRFGFELLAELQFGRSPKRYPMLRQPQQ